MNNKILKDVLRMKLEIMDGIINCLPSALSEKIHKMQKDMMISIKELADEHLEKKTFDENNENVRQVKIE